MASVTVVKPETYRLSEANDGGTSHTLIFDLGLALDLRKVALKWTVNEINYDTYYNVEYSTDGSTWVARGNAWADYQYHVVVDWAVNNIGVSQLVYLRFSCAENTTSSVGELDIYDITVSVNDLVPASLSFAETLDLPVAPGWQGYGIANDSLSLVFPHIITQVEGGGAEPEPEAPTSTNIVAGNVTKMNLPFKAKVTAFSLGSSSKVVGRGESDPITGDYSIDVYPHTSEVLIVVAPDYGRAFIAELLLTEGDLVHPTAPNKYVYKALNNGKVGTNEPIWPTQGEITSGAVTLIPVPLYRPLANGFVKPTIVPI